MVKDNLLIAPLITLGVAVIGLSVYSMSRISSDLSYPIMPDVFPLTIGVVLVFGCFYLYKNDKDAITSESISIWSFATALTGLVIGLWFILHQGIRGGSVSKPVYILLSGSAAGALAGLAIGYYEYKARRYERLYERSKKNFEIVNETSRHHTLNAANIIEGYRAEDNKHIEKETQRIVNTIDSISALSRATTEDVEESTYKINEQLEKEIDKSTRRNIKCQLDNNPIEVNVPPYFGVALRELISGVWSETGETVVVKTDNSNHPRVLITAEGLSLNENNEPNPKNGNPSSAQYAIGKSLIESMKDVTIEFNDTEIEVMFSEQKESSVSKRLNPKSKLQKVL